MNRHAQIDTANENEEEASKRLRVACLTTDFSMQNVLLQLGLSVLSVDGLRVRSAKRWALICRFVSSAGVNLVNNSICFFLRACKTVITDTTKKFCSHCGNDSLRRVCIVGC